MGEYKLWKWEFFPLLLQISKMLLYMNKHIQSYRYDVKNVIL